MGWVSVGERREVGWQITRNSSHTHVHVPRKGEMISSYIPFMILECGVNFPVSVFLPPSKLKLKWGIMGLKVERRESKERKGRESGP